LRWYKEALLSPDCTWNAIASIGELRPRMKRMSRFGVSERFNPTGLNACQYLKGRKKMNYTKPEVVLNANANWAIKGSTVKPPSIYQDANHVQFNASSAAYEADE